MGKKKFEKLKLFLKTKDEAKIVLLFEDLEQLIGERLCNSAYEYQAYWVPSQTHTLANIFKENDYTIFADLHNKRIILEKVSSEIKKVERKSIDNSITKTFSPQLSIHNINENIDDFLALYFLDNHHRYKSYDLCKQVFNEYRHDESKYDYLALMLFTYLASWGMLRNSFLLQKDYRFNLPVVEILCSKTYKTLYENRIPTINDISLILQLKEEIERYYESQYYFNEIKAKTKIKNVSITLTSKIILGTTGMSLAYDRYVRVGLSKKNFVLLLAKNLY